MIKICNLLICGYKINYINSTYTTHIKSYIMSVSNIKYVHIVINNFGLVKYILTF
jgi:hypothetical protein